MPFNLTTTKTTAKATGFIGLKLEPAVNRQNLHK